MADKTIGQMVADGEQTRKKRYEPTDADYKLSSVRISDAENGVVVECGYDLKDDVKDRMRKQASDGVPSFWQYENDNEKHVFEDVAGAKAFIMGELDEMWGKD